MGTQCIVQKHCIIGGGEGARGTIERCRENLVDHTANDFKIDFGNVVFCHTVEKILRCCCIHTYMQTYTQTYTHGGPASLKDVCERVDNRNIIDDFIKENPFLTLSTPAVPNCCCSNGPAPYWSNPLFLIFDIRALCRYFAIM